MKLLFPFILLLHFTVKSQDSSHIKSIPFTYLQVDRDNRCYLLNKAGVIQNDSAWNYVKTVCPSGIGEKPDFTKYTLWQRTSMGDCHAKFRHELFLDTIAKKIIWVEYDYYGGCRAARFEQFRILFSKPPADYTLELREVKKDKRR